MPILIVLPSGPYKWVDEVMRRARFCLPAFLTNHNKRRERSYWIVFLPVLAQFAFAITMSECNEGWEWLYNTLNQSPCSVVQLLIDGPYKMPCTTVVFSLTCACSVCQGGSCGTWSQWISGLNCSIISANGSYPAPISNGTRVPHWAYVPIGTTDTWNVTLAQSAGDAPEVSPTPVSSFQPSSTSLVISQSPSSSPSSNQNKPHAKHGYIAGAIVGGVMGIVLLIAIVFWRRKRAELRPSPSKGGAALSDTSRPIRKYYVRGVILYLAGHVILAYIFLIVRWFDVKSFVTTQDPSDPSTFPSLISVPSMPAIEAMPDSEEGHAAEPIGSRDRTQYNGLPLV
ncbi:hypothetical protein F5148DRAFT_370365 [Russula earlei]|uniref:Uncharacterized protein n=1 Tax=Russula earlei TaxID=71964 RepID=A0ACC0U1F7_9AGAM|nr:hypothetical protein F5148DRAFT_370365 [Russula earlei]